MKKIILIAVIVLAVLYFLKQKVYNPYMWKKAINSEEHQLKVGSFIFSKETGINGSQSYQKYYFVFKVIEIDGDYVRLSVIRQLSQKDNLKESDFSTTSDQYQSLKQNIKSLTVTPILSSDLYKGDGPSLTINDYLLNKYPVLKQSRYYYEDIPEESKNKGIPKNPADLEMYFSLVYSKKEIIENGKLIPWTLTNSFNGKPSLSQYSKNIDLILN
jgi:lipopolysaccharide export LptBFGC system permease protein LptF